MNIFKLLTANSHEPTEKVLRKKAFDFEMRLDSQLMIIVQMKGHISLMENKIKTLLENQIEQDKRFSRTTEALDKATQVIERLNAEVKSLREIIGGK